MPHLFSLPLSFLFQNRTTIIGRIDLIQSPVASDKNGSKQAMVQTPQI
jgi:hypothetical protein